MKLKELLELFDIYCTNITVWKSEDDDTKPVFRGFLSDLPYWLLNTEVDGKLCTGKYTNEHNVTFGALIVEVKDSE